MVLLDHHSKRRLSLAMLVAENKLGHQRQLFRHGVHSPVLDFVGVNLVLGVVLAVAEVKRRENGVAVGGVQRGTDALDEFDGAWFDWMGVKETNNTCV